MFSAHLKLKGTPSFACSKPGETITMTLVVDDFYKSEAWITFVEQEKRMNPAMEQLMRKMLAICNPSALLLEVKSVTCPNLHVPVVIFPVLLRLIGFKYWCWVGVCKLV